MIAQGDGEDSYERHDRRHEEQVHEGKLLGVAEAHEASDLGLFPQIVAMRMPNVNPCTIVAA